MRDLLWSVQDERELESSEERVRQLRADRRGLRRQVGQGQKRLFVTWVLLLVAFFGTVAAFLEIAGK